MPNIKNKSTVEAIAKEFTSNGRNQEQALLTIGYSKDYAGSGQSTLLYANPRVKAAIAKEDAESAAIRDYDQLKAMAEVQSLIDNLTKQVNTGNISANTLLLAAIKEKAELSGLHKQRFIDETDQKVELDTAQATEARKLALIRLSDIAKTA